MYVDGKLVENLADPEFAAECSNRAEALVDHDDVASSIEFFAKNKCDQVVIIRLWGAVGYESRPLDDVVLKSNIRIVDAKAIREDFVRWEDALKSKPQEDANAKASFATQSIDDLAHCAGYYVVAINAVPEMLRPPMVKTNESIYASIAALVGPTTSSTSNDLIKAAVVKYQAEQSKLGLGFYMNTVDTDTKCANLAATTADRVAKLAK
ncbi:hypothetical protein [Rhizobium binae]|uniref:hypothetical protein n=1 Tax=Rhizobium binae TaxID=1138190 RepID=UPI003DA9E956